MPVLTPDLITLQAQELINCVCNALAIEADCGCPCHVYVVTGQPVFDYCCEGQLTAWLDSIYFINNFPNRLIEAATCQTNMGADFKIQYLTCHPSTHDDGSPPTPVQLQDAAFIVNQTLYIAMRALSCCLSLAKRYRSYIIRQGLPIIPQGGCAGWEITVSLEVVDPLPSGPHADTLAAPGPGSV